MKKKTPNLAKAIADYCRWCIYDPGAEGCGTVNEQIERCAAKDCPLWAVRPRLIKKKAS